MIQENVVVNTIATNYPNIQILLSGQLVISNAAQIKKELLTALTNFQSIDLVFENVIKADIAFLQLLIALRKSAIGLDKQVSFDAPASNYLKSLIKNTGLEQILLFSH